MLLGGALAILGGFISNIWQSHSQQRQFDQQLEVSIAQQQHADAVAALREMAAAIDRPVQRALSVARAARNSGVSVDSLQRLVAAFGEERVAWEMSSNRVRLLASIYFADSGEQTIVDLGKRIAWADSMFQTAVEVRRGVSHPERLPPRQRLELRQARDSLLIAIDDALRFSSEAMFATQRVWAVMIQAKKAGAFNPLARYDRLGRITP